MPFQSRNQIKIFQFNLLEDRSIVQAVFTRQGGISPEPFSSLNVGSTVGDDLENVAENRQRSFTAVGRSLESMHDVWQVHSAQVVFADLPRHPETPHAKADIILTDNPDVTLYMRFADCVPILLYDPARGLVGLAHAGWMGTVKKVAAAAVKAMADRYGSKPIDIRAGIGPSICQDHYPVGAEVVQQIRQAFNSDAAQLITDYEDKEHLDLWKANQLTLEQAGVSQIEVSGLCTACEPEDWYSHRGEKGKTGRFGALIGLCA